MSAALPEGALHLLVADEGVTEGRCPGGVCEAVRNHLGAGQVDDVPGGAR